MGKHILLIGVSAGEIATEHTETAIANITALKKALLNDIEGLRDDHVITLLNPDLRQMRHAIALMTYRCRHGDLCLIYYAGCGVISPQSGKFYLTARDTQLNAIPTTAISSDYIHQALPSLQTGLNRVMILDCLWGSLSPQPMDQTLMADPDPRLSASRLADCNCALFTALGSSENPWPMGNQGLSLYTQHLIDGITTSLADVDADGSISIGDLQTYMEQIPNSQDTDLFPIALCPPEPSLGETDDLTTPKGQGEPRTPLLSVKPYSPEREYRRSVEEYARHGQISVAARNVLEFLRYQLGITLQQSQAIEADVMAPYTDRQEHCDRYRQAFMTALELETPMGTPLKKWLRHLQGELSLSYDDVSTIEAQILAQPYPSLQTLPQWLTPVDNTPKLPAHQQNGHADRTHYIG
ncbi:MAG: hypothetical protein AAF579_18750 [Cyanobacteria bacterium P01_C01_bin.118]